MGSCLVHEKRFRVTWHIAVKEVVRELRLLVHRRKDLCSAVRNRFNKP